MRGYIWERGRGGFLFSKTPKERGKVNLGKGVGCSSRIPFRRGVRLHLGEGKRWVASVATLQLAFGSEKGKEKNRTI